MKKKSYIPPVKNGDNIFYVSGLQAFKDIKEVEDATNIIKF